MSKLLRVLFAAALLAGGVACKDQSSAPQSGATGSDSTVAGNTNPGAKPGDPGTSGSTPSDSTTAQGGTGNPPGTS
ncbi:MAG TPA: hypothetical protein VIU02_03415, partial [Burkholderiales bacterium]